MKRIISTLLLTIILLPFAKAQNVTTNNIKWNSQSTLEANEGQQTEEATSFITHGTTNMEWKEANGTIRKNFQVIQIIGQWTDASQPGWMQYEVTDGTASGTISIKKNATETKVFIALVSEPPQSYVLTINGYQVL